MNFIKTMTLSVVAGALSSAAPVIAKTTHYIIDKSASNSVVTDADLNRLVARQAAATVMKLRLGNRVSVRTFGDINNANPLRYDAQLTRRSSPPRSVARDVARLISRSGASDAPRQSRTEITAVLEWNRYDCSAGDHIIILTDGVETGAVRSPNALLDGRERLPLPRAGFLRGCTVSFWGFGRVTSGQMTSTQVNNLRNAWSEYFRVASARFDAVPNP